jgi:hypothetical protein
MNLLKQFSFKQRHFFEMLSSPPTEEQRIGERNMAILGWIFWLGVIGLICLGFWKVGELIIGLFH